ncbi:MAG TPA: TolC family protein [Drouetiella sp.]
MMRKPYGWRNSLLATAGSCYLACQPALSDDAQLRPALPTSNAAQAVTTESKSVTESKSADALGNTTSTKTTTKSKRTTQVLPPSGPAARSSESDFLEHRADLKTMKRSQPSSAETGATSQDDPAILNVDPTSSVTSGSLNGNPSGIASDTIPVNVPKLESLISVNEYLNPFTLDAKRSSTISLKNALDVGLERNLDLAISLAQTKSSKFDYYSSLGKFLPDPTAGFSEYFAHGHIGLPFNIASAFGSGTGATAAAATSSSAFSTTASTIKTSGRDTTVTVNRPFEVMHAGAEFYAYRGGSVLFGALRARNNYRARTHGERATLSDTLLAISQNYYNLVLAETVLQIRVDAVKTSEEQYRRNQARNKAGLATKLEVLQSKTQLSRDRQALVDQQINRRSAAITLSDSLNVNLGEDLTPETRVVEKIRLVDPKLSVGQVLQMAIDHRPELKQYEQLRRAAKKAIIVAGADLQPSVVLSGQAYGIGPPSNVNALGVFSVSANWRLRGLGTVDSMQMVKAKWDARQAALQSQKELQTVCSQVRNAYLQVLDKERNITETTDEVVSATEELRLAQLRKTSGLGINLDIITAQRDLTQARVDKAQAIINYNIAQVQLLHDTGLISISNLTAGRLLGKTDL